jgi:DNA-binding transcriptional ArsR family regulator
MERFLAITRALSDPSRVRMLCALRSGELCVCQLIELLRLAPSTVSKHLSLLNQAGLVESRKDGRWVYYRIPKSGASEPAARMTRETFRALSDSTEIADDHKRLAEIRKADLDQLCRQIQCKS